MENDKLHNLRHTLAHLLAAAVGKIYKFDKIKLTLGPSVENGFYYDIDFGDEKISDSDLKKIEDTMRKELPKWTEWEQKELNKEDALNLFKNEYKIELINEIADRGEKITTYTCGGFTDLCRGGHLENPALNIDPLSFKLDRVAGAYWRGDEKNKMLTRIYGLAFETKEELDTYLLQREEALKRDHKKIGKEMGLFTISELVGKGLPMYLPKGNIIRTQLENFIRKEKENLGYSFVTIPHIAKKELYIRSGHMGKYDAMMPTMTDENGEEFVMKAMNCPHHFEIYNAEPHSYRDLPLRIAENTTVYRNEKSGELSGLLRVKNLTQDDTHHFIRTDQIESEIEMIFELMQKVYKIFNFKDYKIEISIRDPKNKKKYFGSDEVWEKAENILIQSAKKMNLQYSVEEGEAAFYGPKIDIKVKDSIGRQWQLTTIQLDFNQPENFDMNYTGEDGKKHRVVVLHVAIFGSFERFMGVMIEHYAGVFPLWLSPVQVKIIPVRTNHNEYAKEVYNLLKENNIRVELDDEESNLGGKVRDAKNNKIPYWIVIGDKEIEANKVTIESRDAGPLGQMTKEELLSKLTEEIKEKK
ncbi:MAG: threonine--tRNA ligase [Burkholderiales bacterium]|nr:threonine--tRNA ligase [Burkholderiales bacterium]